MGGVATRTPGRWLEASARRVAGALNRGCFSPNFRLKSVFNEEGMSA